MADRRVRALADDYWETFLEANPTSATILGDHRFDDQIEDLSAAGEQRLRERWIGLRDRLAAIDRSPLDLDDRVTCYQLDQEMSDAVTGIDERLRELQSDQMTGFHVGLLISAPLMSASDEESARRLVERLHRIPAALEQAGQRFLEGLAAGRTPARVCVERSLNVIDSYLATPLDLDVFTSMGAPPGWGNAAPWRADLEDVARRVVRPAFAQLATLLRERLLPVGRNDDHCGLRWLDDGDRIYATLVRHHTTVDCTPEEIHQFGMAEVTAKLPKEYAEVAGRLFGLTDPADVFERLRGDPTLRYQGAEEILASARANVESASSAVGEWFGRLPRTACAVEPVPAFVAADAPGAYYFPPAPDGSRQGTYFVNTGDPQEKTRYDDAAIGFHEAVPGHHLQLTIASELDDLPRFRRFSFANAAYCEGWGLYAERLADEMGLYPSDLDRIGMLSADSLRSCRLVVDTGLHAMGWSRDQAVEFMVSHTPMSRGEVVVEVDRYIAMPGQALAYKVGQREILRLREAAQAALGRGFDIKGFHDTVLGSGAIGLPVLREVVEHWITNRT